MEPNASSSVSP